MKKAIKPGDDTFQLLMDLKELMETYGQPEEDPAYWGELSDAVGRKYHKYEGNPYKELFTTLAFCIENKAKSIHNLTN